MSKRVSSSDWTGPTGEEVQRGAFTHRVGDFGGTTDYAWVSRKNSLSLAIPEELHGIVRRAAWLIVSPAMLVAAWIAGDVGAPGAAISDPSPLLVIWGVLIAAIGSWQLISRSFHLIILRSFMLSFLLVGTAAISIAYFYVAQDAQSGATAGKAERVFQYVAGPRKRHSAPVFRHQRADGNDVEGQSRRPPFDYGSCITVQLVTGRNGFRWLRVVEQRPPLRPGQIGFPVRRADCFSDRPLASLPR